MLNYTKILINGQELLEKVPILKYPIIAEREVIVEAYNPISNLRDQVKITLKPGETREIDLVLGRAPSSTK